MTRSLPRGGRGGRRRYVCSDEMSRQLAEVAWNETLFDCRRLLTGYAVWLFCGRVRKEMFDTAEAPEAFNRQTHVSKSK